MPAGTVIEIQGLRQLRDKLGRFAHAVDAEAQQILMEAAGVAQTVARDNARKDLETMARGIHVEPHALSVSVISDEPYSYVQEFGRSAGAKAPSTDAMQGWGSRHGFLTKGAIFLLSRSIGRKGFKGAFFMAKGAKAADTYVRQRLVRASAKLTGYWSGP